MSKAKNGRIIFLTLQIRLGVITLNDIPEEYRDAVENKLNNKNQDSV